MKKKHLSLAGLTPPAALRAAMWAGALAFAFASGPGRSVAADLYVATNGAGPDGLTWATATNSIQGAIDAISEIYSTNTVWVSNGVYEVGGVTNFPTGMGLTNRVAIYKAITVRSANNDPTNTIIKGIWDPLTTNGPAAVRCVYMTNGSSLIGFMLTNGATWSTIETGGIINSNRLGGGVLCSSTNTVISNCVIAGNAANYFGGGAYQGTLYNCTLTGNKSDYQGGGADRSTLYNCILTDNYAYYCGGGVNRGSGEGGILYNCTLTGNWSGTTGNGGGVQGCTLYNCILTGNYTLGTWGGGGGRGGTLYNCLIANNSSAGYGGGWVQGTLYNCTIVSNRAPSGGGGVDGQSTYITYLYNCVSWSNSTTDFRVGKAYYSCGVGYTNGTGGTFSGNITNNPLFVASGSGNWRLGANSPSVNTGTNYSWMADSSDVRSKDLDGRSRIGKFSGRVDMGCYEDLPSGIIFKAY